MPSSLASSKAMDFVVMTQLPAIFVHDTCTCQVMVGLGLQKPWSLYEDLFS